MDRKKITKKNLTFLEKPIVSIQLLRNDGLFLSLTYFTAPVL